MSEPLVSVKMITYNHAPYIVQAIEGVLMQKTNFPFDLVIGEDCSTDGTREIVFDYAKRHPEIIRVVTSDENVGARKNSLRTNEAFRGKYIAWCEGDDYWCREDKLQMQVDYLESHPEYGLVHSEIDVYYEHNQTLVSKYQKKQNVVNNKEFNDLFYEILVNNYLLQTCSVCVRTNLFLEVLENEPLVFKTNRFLLGDKALWLELSKISKFHYINETLAIYRKHEGGVSFNVHEPSIQFELSVFDLITYYIDKYNYKDKVPNSFLDKYANDILGYAFDKMDYKLACVVKEKRGFLSPKLLMLYYGSKNKFAHNLLKPFVFIKRKL